MRERNNYPKYYENLVNFPKDIPSPFESQIEMDLNRTFPNDPYFKLKSTIISLKNVLLAYSRRNVTIGYCQGFNFIVGRLLKVLGNEENAFWVFVQMIENILPFCYYSELTGIIADTSILHILLKLYFEDLYDHFVSLNYDLSINNIIYKWFVSLFIQNMNEEMSYIVWDSLFLEGNIVLFYATLAMFFLSKKDLLECSAMEDIHILLDDNISNYCNPEVMIWFCLIKRYEFDYNFINKQRTKTQSDVKQAIINMNKGRIEALKASHRQASYTQEITFCKKDWPMCIYDLDYKHNILTNFMVFKSGIPIICKEDYVIFKFKEEFQRKASRSIMTDNKRLMENPLENKSKINHTIVLKHPKSKLVDFEEDIENQQTSELNRDTYLSLVIERRIHTCPSDHQDSQTEIEESDDMVRNRANTILQEVKLILKKNEKDKFKNVVSEIKENNKEVDKVIIQTFKDKIIVNDDYEFDY